jgi:hypothetical protein
MMEAVCPLKMTVKLYSTTQCHIIGKTKCLTPSVVQTQLVQGVGNPESPTATDLPPIWHPCGVSFHLVRSIWGSEWQATLGFLKANTLCCDSNIFLLITVSSILSLIQSSSDTLSVSITLLQILWSVVYDVWWICVPWYRRTNWLLYEYASP